MRGQLVFLVGVAGGIAHATFAFKKCAYTRLCCSSDSRVVEMNGRLRSYSSESDSANGHQPSSSEKRLTICVVGSGGVGKSSLTVRYLQGHFPEFYDPTVEESYITQIEYGFDQHDVEIIDTAGQEEFMLFRDSSLAKGDAFLALFAINSVSSWYGLQELRKKIIREHEGDDSLPLVVIANKSDLDNERQVNLDEVLEVCQKWRCPLLETSAKTGLNVTESFRLLMDRVVELRPGRFRESIMKPPVVLPRKTSKHCTIS